jgi:small subunit ribosomal protein S1
MSGTVTSIKGYGAFVDIGGVEGMLHISELSFTRVEHPSEVVSVGQELEVQVIKIEKTNNPKRPEKIGLSLKALAKDPWTTAFEELEEGMQLRGKVMRTQPFGAFVEVRPGVEGLVHISQMTAGRRIQHPREVVSEGDEVDVVILGLEPDRRRISLSMSELSRREEDRNVEEYRSGGPEAEGGGRRGGRRDRRDGGRRGGRRDRREGGRRDGGWDDSGGRPRESNGGNKLGTFGDLLKYKKR